ncbi:hypothetical protein BGLA2_860018 [Burkholderia gladioli]|nr:hypothetical protein BGLA2_860018 [Burkholderia gladioli]
MQLFRINLDVRCSRRLCIRVLVKLRQSSSQIATRFLLIHFLDHETNRMRRKQRQYVNGVLQQVPVDYENSSEDSGGIRFALIFTVDPSIIMSNQISSGNDLLENFDFRGVEIFKKSSEFHFGFVF